MSDEPGFLSRWARRKQATLRGEVPAEVVPKTAEALAPLPGLAAMDQLHGLPAEVAPVPGPQALAPLPGPVATDQLSPVEGPPASGAQVKPVAAEPFDAASLPPVELLDAASDFTAFLKPGVPAVLRSAALRKAWTADPLIRNYLSPLDYGWDFNTPGGLPFGFSDTLGEGANKVLQLIRQAIGEPEPPPDPDAPPAEATPESIPLEEPPPGATVMAEAIAPDRPATEPEPAEPPRRRHGGALPA